MIIHGKTGDHRSARPFQGMYTSPDGKEWGNSPYTAEQREEEAKWKAQEEEWDIRDKILLHIGIDGTFGAEYKLIKEKKSNLPANLRKFLVENYESGRLYDDGEEKEL